MTEASRNPWFNMVTKKDNESIDLILKQNQITRRQDAPKVYNLTTVAYVLNQISS